MPPNTSQNLVDRDDIQTVTGFKGYQNNSDITTVNADWLVPPSQNVIFTGDTIKSIETRSGYKLLGHPGAAVGFGGIRSKYDNFVNSVGIKLPIREWVDAIGVGQYDVFYNGDWRQLKFGTTFPHELSFTEWFNDDTVLPALIWVGGNQTVDYWGGQISSVTAFTVNTVDIFDDPLQLGFPATGTFIVNGTLFTYTGITGNQFTGVTPDPTGLLIIGDIATYNIQTFILEQFGVALTDVPTLDICAALENQVFYGSYESRTIFVTNERVTDSVQRVNTSFTNLDNLIITGTYSGSAATVQNTIKVEIVAEVPGARVNGSSAGSGVVNFGGLFTPLTYGIFVITIDPGATTFSWTETGGSGASGAGVALGTTPIPLADGITVSFSNGTYFTGDTYDLYIGRQDDPTFGNTDLYQWYLLDVNGDFQPQGSPTPISTPLIPLNYGITINWNVINNGAFNGHKVGDYWIIELTPAVRSPWVDTFFAAPIRLPGQGDLIKLDSPVVTMAVQESFMYINCRSGLWETAQFVRSADLLSEIIKTDRIKTSYSNKSLRNCLSVHTKDDIAFINIDNQLMSLGRILNIQSTPMSEVISLAVKNDFYNLNFVPGENGIGIGHLDWADNKIFVCVPTKGVWYMYDDFYQLWNPPQTGNFSSISVINGQVCAHSSIVNETYVLFSASNDNGYPFKAIAAFPYNSDGRFPAGGGMVYTYDNNTRRDRLKEVSKLFTEGYKSANTNLYAKVNLEWGNAKNGPDIRLDPIVFTPTDHASIGQSELAGHPLANDPVEVLTKFHHFLPFNREFVYEYQIQYYSDDIDLYFKLISTGVNAVITDQRNVQAQQNAGTSGIPVGYGVAGTPKIIPLAGGLNLPGDQSAGAS